MKIAPKIISALALCTAWTLAQAAQNGTANGNVLYRYTNENGVQVLDDLVPPRYVSGGYEVLTPSGRVLKVVPPELTGEELAERQRREKQLEADRNLLRRYNSVADIESARARKLAIVEQDMAIMRSNISSLTHQIEQEEAAAARTQRNGGTVAPELLARISDLRVEVSVLRERMSRREEEAERINREFNQAASRFAKLEGN